MSNVLLCSEIDLDTLAQLLARFGLSLERVADGDPIPGSWFGDPEAGIIARRVLIRGDTPVHSALHESCHLICMDEARRAVLHTNAGGDYDEENAVNYMEITLGSYLPDVGRDRILADMDCWGYTFRLGSARAWFEQDAEDARQWLLHHDLLNEDGTPRWKLRN
ncbi:MAG: hypothetical protein OEZ16_07800 [Chromatiales bacterium]|nr:hypothetical protein [Chromatiales bacterium]